MHTRITKYHSSYIKSQSLSCFQNANLKTRKLSLLFLNKKGNQSPVLASQNIMVPTEGTNFQIEDPKITNTLKNQDTKYRKTVKGQDIQRQNVTLVYFTREPYSG